MSSAKFLDQFWFIVSRPAQSGGLRGLVRRRPILTGRKNVFKIRPNRLSHQQDWSTSQTTYILSYWTWIIIHICKFNFVQKHKRHQIMSLFTQNRQCYVGRKWGTLTDLEVTQSIGFPKLWYPNYGFNPCAKHFKTTILLFISHHLFGMYQNYLSKHWKRLVLISLLVQFTLPQVALNCHKHTETNTPNVTLTRVNLFNMCPNHKS